MFKEHLVPSSGFSVLRYRAHTSICYVEMEEIRDVYLHDADPLCMRLYCSCDP